jgi:hypothetical protein
VDGTFQWHRRGITGRGPVECRSPLIRYTAWVAFHEFAGKTSQGVPVRAELGWLLDPVRWMTGRPPYIDGTLHPVIGLLPPPGPFAAVLLGCPDGPEQQDVIAAEANPRTGQLSARPSPMNPGEQFVLTGRVSPLATTGPASVSLEITATERNDSGDGFCTGSATFQATELAPLVP